jgi:hypothetical protein
MASPPATPRTLASQPIPRAGLPEDIARAALYLASDASSFVNGIDLVVDGGALTGARFSAGAASRRELGEAVKADRRLAAVWERFLRLTASAAARRYSRNRIRGRSNRFATRSGGSARPPSR